MSSSLEVRTRAEGTVGVVELLGDVSAEELQDFRRKFEAAAWSGPI